MDDANLIFLCREIAGMDDQLSRAAYAVREGRGTATQQAVQQRIADNARIKRDELLSVLMLALAQ